MKFLDLLDKTVKKNNSLLCIGLDQSNFDFNQKIISATRDLVCAYKPNIAFYEKDGLAGLESLLKTIELIREAGVPVILDAKRGDIGHTAEAYAESIFQVYKADAVTVNPYLGGDSIEPFAKYTDKGVFILCLTSNPGAMDFQANIYKTVAQKAREWNKNQNLGLVVGATKPEQLKEIAAIAGDLPFLIPGVGAQGGDLAAAVKYGGKHPIINVSRAIANAKDPRIEAERLREEINQYRL